MAQSSALQPVAPRRGLTIAAVGLFLLALGYTMALARTFLVPIVFALLLGFLLRPMVRRMARWGIPTPLGATVVVAGMVGIVVLAAFTLSGPMERWLEQAPAQLEQARDRMDQVVDRFRGVQQVARQMEEATTGSQPDGATVTVRQTSTLNRVFGTTQALVTQTLEMLFLLFFLLASGDLFLEKLVKVLPNRSEKRKAVDIAREIEATIATHLRSVAILCVSEGAVVALAMWLIGLPSPALWGALAAVLELAPYIGAAVMTVILTLAGVGTFDSVGMILLAPGIFLLISLLQGNLLAPLLHGRRLALNPLAILVSLMFWWTIWGIPGALVAVPITAAIKVVCDRTESGKAVGEFLGR